MTFFVILEGKLDVERREDPFFWVITDIFSGNKNRKLRPPSFQISRHAPGRGSKQRRIVNNVAQIFLKLEHLYQHSKLALEKGR